MDRQRIRRALQMIWEWFCCSVGLGLGAWLGYTHSGFSGGAAGGLAGLAVGFWIGRLSIAGLEVLVGLLP